MKYAAVAATLTGAVFADGWESWSSTTKPADPSTWTQWTTPSVKPTTTWSEWDPKSTTWSAWTPEKPESSSTTWSDWDPKKSTTWSDWDPKESSTTWSAWTTPSTTWGSWTTTSTTSGKCAYVTEYPVTKCKGEGQCWEEKTKSTIYADKCTWSDWVDPAKSTTWADWNTWSTTTSSAKCSYVTEVPVTKCKGPGQCWEDKTTTTIYADTCTWASWTKTPVKPTGDYTWNTWETPVKATGTWNTWATPVKATGTWNTWATPVKATETASTWVDWNNVYDSTKVVKTTVVETKSTWASWSVVTSVVTPAWSSNGWFGGAWPTAKSDECVSNVVTSYGYPSWKPVPEASKVSTVWSNVVSASAVPTWSNVPAAPVKPCTGKGCAPIKPNGNKWSMTYSPYTAEGKCKSSDVIKSDIKKIYDMGFTSVRIYSTDCGSLEYIGGACKEYGLTIILGVFISSTGIEGAKAEVAAIKAWAQWDIVELIVVGNESVFQGFCTAEELVAFISSCKTEFAAAGYTGSCTTTEPLASWQKSGSAFCAVVDVVAANLYAFFNDQCTAEGAGAFIQSEITILSGICPGKDTYVMESGWPSAGECNGAACPSKDNQAVAIKSIQEECGAKIVFFSFEDELWKEPGQYGVEQHWGVSEVFAGSSWSNVPVKATTTTATAWTAVPVKATTTPAKPTSTWAEWGSY